ncbi:MTG2 [Candida margitis]|uniref:MTG2 n=1 Tax=Candida margitis TaxID=1775924 RepID=UPI002227B45B|nr:MTG2 [Candida margitis]KAI5968228.1 MTG2 [Candida margitis]
MCRTMFTSPYLRNDLGSSSFAPNYAFYNAFPDTLGKEISTKIISSPGDETQTIKISQIIDNPSPTTAPTEALTISRQKPKPRNIISIADYFSGNSHHLHHVFYSNLIHAKTKKAAKIENKKFVDLKIMKLTSGSGGNGAVSFFRDNLTTSGPPDGGDGGCGGNIYINVVDRNLNSLHYLQKRYVAKSGAPGKGGQLDGKNGDDVIIDIPLGTVIRWIPDPTIFKKYISKKEGDSLDDVYMELELDMAYGKENVQLDRHGYKPGDGWIFKEHDKEYYQSRDFFQELDDKVIKYDEEMEFEEQQQDQFPILGMDCDKVTTKPLLLLNGGKGGLGNMHFLTSNVRNPRFCKVGRSGITAHFLLELKLIADLGLVGLPNAGKSSLLRAISRAKPRVGHWEFTTLQPTIGTIRHRIDSDPFTVADIPGIIKGASENKGMGLDFLRHIERSGGLVFVVSLESTNPVDDLQTLINEVGPTRMKDKKVLVVATKADLSNEGENYQTLKQFIETTHGGSWKIVPVCAPRGENIDQCLELMSEIATHVR